MQREREISYTDCHVGDRFKLDIDSPFAQFYLVEEGVRLTEKDEIVVKVREKRNKDLELIVDIFLNGNFCGIWGDIEDKYDYWLEDDSYFPENDIQKNLKVKNFVKQKRKNNYY